MRSTLRIFWVILALTLAALAPAQSHSKWSATVEPSDVRRGEATTLFVRLELETGWHAYQIGQTGGPLGIEIELLPNAGVESLGKVLAPEAKTKFDSGFKIDVGYYEGSVVFGIPVRLASDVPSATQSIPLKVRVKAQTCNDVGCDRPREETLSIDLAVAPGESRAERIVASLEVPKQPEAAAATPSGSAESQTQEPTSAPKDSSLFGIFIAGVLGGLLALLTPCVFPMIPVTISFFSKLNPDDARGHMKAALLYCAGIIVSFTALGMIVTIALGKNGTFILANNIWVNLGLFLLFVVLAMSLFGVFELVLPASFVTKISSPSRRGGIIAPLLMGLTFALTSFTCTVPVVGGLLAGAAAGDRLYPIVGMLGFSGALALPFLLLAFFPKMLQALPRAGAWMVTAKAFMGFLELVAALKFLSNIDLVLKWGLITKPVFLAVWSTLFLMAGLHLYGWIKLPHDAGGKIGMARRAIAVATFAIGVYCLGAINGAPMGVVVGLLPPSDYGIPSERRVVPSPGSATWIKEDYPKALAESKASGKPLFIDFTGYT
jgi:thiol:disulfide interchange protein DsbD